MNKLDKLEEKKKNDNKEAENGIEKESIFVIQRKVSIKSYHFVYLVVMTFFSSIMIFLTYQNQFQLNHYLAILSSVLTLIASICCYFHSKDIIYTAPMILYYITYYRFCPRLIYKEDFNEKTMLLAEKVEFEKFWATQPYKLSQICKSINA